MRVKPGTGVVSRRICLIGIGMLLLFAGLIAQIFYLQIIRHERLTTLARSNRIKILPSPPTRGLIFSSDGVLLADNRPSFTLTLAPERMTDPDAVIQRLSEIIAITPEDVRNFKALRKTAKRFESIPLRANIKEEEVARVSVNRRHLPGVDIQVRSDRYYPLGEHLSHVLGYVGMIDEDEEERLDKSNYRGVTHIGKTGIEKAYQDLLHGHIGYQQVEVNVQGRKVRQLDKKLPEPSKNLYLTLDASLQILAAQSLRDRRGAIVAMDVNSGALLISVSAPGFDPNQFIHGIDRQSYYALLRSSDTPLLNRFLQGQYPPGSTIKPMLALAALNGAVRQPEAKTWCPGWYSLAGSSHRYRDWKKEGHGHMGMADAIAQSCDVYFYSLARSLGIDQIHRSLTGFGFGAPTNVDVGGEAPGLVPSRQWKRERLGQPWYPGETLIAGIGQGYLLVTPIQLVVATAAIANRGTVLRPYLLAEARDPTTGRSVIRTPPRQSNQPAISAPPEHWEIVIQAMTEVVHGARGTARRAGAGADYRFAGKTGTAQVIAIAQDEEYNEEEVPEEYRDHALFIAFAPVEAPEIALAIIVENGGSGSRTAAPIARALLDHYFGKRRQAQRSQSKDAGRSL